MEKEMRKEKQDEKFTHVIFDMDGLLLDTERIYTEIFERIAEEYGGIFNWDIKVQMMGRSSKTGGLELQVKLMKLSISTEEFSEALQKHQEELFPSAKLLPGAEKLVRHLHKHGIPIAVASGSDTANFKRKTVNHQQFFQLFPIIILGDHEELKQGKPAPDQFLITRSKFPDLPSCGKVLVFEDSPNGVIAAKAAGMGVVLVPDERLDKTMYNDPTLAIKSLEEFVPEQFGFPPYET